ncbi:MAG: preprotein translocase subunit SecD [Ilumatobacteraceae bacterium]
MRRRLILTLLSIVVLAYGGFAAVVLTGTEPALGLDLQGGISVTQRVKPGTEYSEASLALAVERIRDRVDSLGVAEPEILSQGDTIVVNLPGVKNQQQAVDLVQVTGRVLLRPVIGECQEVTPQEPTDSTEVPSDSTTPSTGSADTTVPAPSTTTASSTTAATDTTVAPSTTGAPGQSRSITATDTTVPLLGAAPSTTTGTTTTSSTSTSSTSTVPATSTTTPGTTTTTEPPVLDENGIPVQESDPYGQQYLQVKGTNVYCPVGPAWNPDGADPIEGSGEVFTDNAVAAVLDTGWGVTVDLNDGNGGRSTWNEIASACYNQSAQCPSGQLAIELDGIIQSNPSMNEPFFSGGVQISGQFTQAEASALAEVINSGSLPVQLKLEAVQSVSPSLGEGSLRAAVISGLAGVLLVLLFMIAYYRLLGLIVAIGLTVSGTLIYAVVSLLSRTQGLALSLSGIAGIIVSVGVTVDSYVVFFERLKDEVKSGKTMRNSAQRGFTNAWRAIVVADLVSLLGALVLWYLTVGAVRGFAFFLGLSTLTDMLVAYTFTRPTVLLLARTKWMERRKVMGIEVAAAGGTA